MFFRKKAQDYESESIFYSLAALDNVDKNNIYYNKFRTALEKKCRLIAFTGRYGIGKTSIINSIIKKLGDDYKYIRISLGNYKHLADTNTINDGEQEHTETGTSATNNNFDINEIEIKILQQIIYTTDETELPMSRFKRIKFIGTFRKIISLCISLLIMGLVYVYYKSFYDNLLGKMYEVVFNLCNNRIISNILKYSLLVLIFYCLYQLIIFVTVKLSVFTFKYKNLEISISKADGKSIFNKYLDEIVYFFKQTKTKILVIEDLDRYGNNSLEIFKKLKELNYLLNSNKTIRKNGGVTFIYALRDDLFQNSEDRVKFFDSIIPIVSKFSSQNSREYIIELYNEFKEKYKDKYKINIDEKLLRIISYYIGDRRLLLNIFMEFKTYIDVLQENQTINCTELFAVICYKNINPSDYEKRLNYEGDLYNIFENKEKFVNILNSNLISANRIINEEIDNMKKYQRLNLIDIKKAFIIDAIKSTGSQVSISNMKIMIGDRELSYDCFLSKEVDYEQLKNSSIQLKIGYYPTNINSEIVDGFKEKVKHNNYDFNIKRDEIEKNISLIEINNSKSIEEVLNTDNLLELINDSNLKKIFNNKLLISLVKNGFIKENYEKNLSFFKKGDLTSEDYSFLIFVDTNDKLDFDYKINNVMEVMKQIDSKSFGKECVLNNNVCDFLLLSKDKFTKRKNFLNQFLTINEYKLKFLENYLNHKENNFVKLIKEIASSELLLKVIQDKSIIKDKNKWIKLILENIKLDKIDDIVSQYKKYLEENSDILNIIQINDIFKLNIKLLSPYLDDYSNIKVNMIEILYICNVYEYNISFFIKLCELYDIDYDGIKDNFIDLIIENDNFKKYKDGIKKSIKFADIYNSFENYKNGPNNIIKLINEEGIIEENKKLIIDNEENIIKNIDDINDSDFWDYIIRTKKCDINMNNLLLYYDSKQEINDIVEMLINDLGDNYVAVNDDRFKSMEKNLMCINSDNILNYNAIADNFDYIVTSIENEEIVNIKLLELLIDRDKVELNKQIYNYLLDNERKTALKKLVYNKFDSFLEIVNNIEVEYSTVDYILQSNIDLSCKLKLIYQFDLDEVDSVSIDKVVNDIIEKNAVLDDKYTNELFNRLSLESQYKYFEFLYNQNIENLKYLHVINNKIRNGRSTYTNINLHDGLEEFLIFLRDKSIINDYNIKKDKARVSFSKTTI